MRKQSISPTDLARHVLELAHDQGFHLAATLLAGSPAFESPAAEPVRSEAMELPRTASHYQRWLAQGFHGEMAYMARPDALAKRLHPDRLLSGLRSLLVVGINYHTFPLSTPLRSDPSLGLVAAYAWGVDYHAVVRQKLASVALALSADTGLEFEWKAFVDTGPILERDLAAEAGLGFFGNNTCLISPRVGSWLFLGELLLTLDLPPVSSILGRVQSAAGDVGLPTCGRCLRCLEACPTGALVAPNWLDARRCISYLTIEARGPVPRELRSAMGNRIFGCDICQEVCPWNERFSSPTSEPAFYPAAGPVAPRLLDLLDLDEDGFARRFGSSPVRRTGRRGLLRNAAIALGNWRNPEAVPSLARAIHDSESLVRGHAAWALGQVGTPTARRSLEAALSLERDSSVKDEIMIALAAG